MQLHEAGRRRLRADLDRTGHKHRDLAAAVGWQSHGMIGHLLARRKFSVADDRARRLAEILDVPLADLFVPEVPRNSSDGSTGTKGSDLTTKGRVA